MNAGKTVYYSVESQTELKKINPRDLGLKHKQSDGQDAKRLIIKFVDDIESTSRKLILIDEFDKSMDDVNRAQCFEYIYRKLSDHVVFIISHGNKISNATYFTITDGVVREL